MPIEWVPEMSIFDHPHGVALVNPVNCVGTMGAGLARKFKERFPAMYEQYKRLCLSEQMKIGSVKWAYDSGRWIVLFPTKNHFRRRSSLSYIQDGLIDLGLDLSGTGTDIAIPKLGCGLGGLQWMDVHPLIVRYLGDRAYTVYVHGKKNEQ